jgi:predicted deacetylase
MSPIDRPALCVSIHDVAPATWPDCLRIHRALAEVADIPITWLVVPCYRGNAEAPKHYVRAGDGLLERGHELALHGYNHVDTGPPPNGAMARLLRHVVTQGEGEFAAIDMAEARRKLDLGTAWFARRGWPLSGFVAPAWMIGTAAWKALLTYPFQYTSTYRKLYWLASCECITAPTLVYAARNRSGRIASPILASTMAALYRSAPVLRLALHPRDAHHPSLLRHAQGLLQDLLATRMPLTKAALAARYQGPQRDRAPMPR